MASTEDQVYLRTAISVDADGWANFDYVKMPDYRWGIFLAPTPSAERKIGISAIIYGEARLPVEVPGEHRNALRRLIVTQGDTEPASGRAAAPCSARHCAERSTTSATCSR